MSALALAWRNLLHQKLRSLVSLTGVAFAVILVFMQLGFLDSVRRTATQFFDVLDFDLAMVSKDYIEINRTTSFPEDRLGQAQAGLGVRSVKPLYLGMNLWKDPRPGPENDLEPRRWNIMVIGSRPSDLDQVFREADGGVFASRDELQKMRAGLARPNTVIMDRQSWPEYGERSRGSSTELGGQRVTVAGDCSIGTGFGYNALVLVSDNTFWRVMGQPPRLVNLGLIRLEAGADPRRAKEQLTQALPDDVIVLTREELNAQETDYWLNATSVGQFFSLGVVVAVVVGTIFVYQMITADIRKHQVEYATLKAVGYPGSYLSWVVISQALLLALLGYLPGLASALGCYAMTRQLARIPIVMTGWIALGVLVLTLAMCTLSGLLALRRVQAADPADLF